MQSRLPLIAAYVGALGALVTGCKGRASTTDGGASAASSGDPTLSASVDPGDIRDLQKTQARIGDDERFWLISGDASLDVKEKTKTRLADMQRGCEDLESEARHRSPEELEKLLPTARQLFARCIRYRIDMAEGLPRDPDHLPSSAGSLAAYRDISHSPMLVDPDQKAIVAAAITRLEPLVDERPCMKERQRISLCPRLVWGGVTVTGGTRDAPARQVLENHWWPLTRCYVDLQAPDRTGVIRYALAVSMEGYVTQVLDRGSTFQGRWNEGAKTALQACMYKVLRALVFPPPLERPGNVAFSADLVYLPDSR
jgi:hypothetical protein